MAFTDYKTWSVGETLTAANFNAQIRDNGLTMPPHLIVRKTADETVTSSTAFQDDDQLLMALATNTTYLVRLVVLFTAVPSTGDIKFQFTMPTACSVFMNTIGFQVSGGTVNVGPMVGTTSPTGTSILLGLNTGAAGDVRVVPFEGVVINGANAGNLTLQWAQNTSSGTGTVVKANSTLWAVKLA